MRPQHADQPLGQLRQIIINFFAQATNGKGKAFKQALNVRVRRTGFIEIQHRRPIGVSLRERFCRLAQVAHFSVKISQG